MTELVTTIIQSDISDIFETKKYIKTKYYFNKDDKETCQKSIPWKSKDLTNSISNIHFKTFNQLIFHAGDLNDFYRYGLLYSHFFNFKFKKKKQKLITELKSPLYKSINTLTTHNTFTYLFNKFKKGVYKKYTLPQIISKFLHHDNMNASTHYQHILLDDDVTDFLK